MCRLFCIHVYFNFAFLKIYMAKDTTKIRKEKNVQNTYFNRDDL